MNLQTINILLLVASLLLAAAPLLLYPLGLRLAALLFGRAVSSPLPLKNFPTVSLICVVRNGRDMLRQKLDNSFALSYPKEKLQIVVYSDGSTDDIESLEELNRDDVIFLAHDGHKGKNESLNNAVKGATGEVLFFSDTDAILESNALTELLRPMADASIGGVCGRRIIGEKGEFAKGQEGYISFDSAIKELESALGSVSSNDGKLYVMRRELFRPISPASIDDLYNALSVVLSGQRMVYQPTAHAYIKMPARNLTHEISRRRRVVIQGLTGIFDRPEIFNPFRTGFFGVSLFFNKVIRRMLPLALLLVLVTSIVGAATHWMISLFLAGEIVFLALAAVHYILFERLGLTSRWSKPTGMIFFFVLGNYGLLLGLLDYVCGKRVVKWNPIKKSD